MASGGRADEAGVYARRGGGPRRRRAV